MGTWGWVPTKLFNVPLTFISPNSSPFLNEEPFSSLPSDKASNPHPNATTFSNLLLLSSFKNIQPGHEGAAQKGFFGYNCLDTSNNVISGDPIVVLTVARQSVVDLPPFGSLSNVPSDPICFSAAPKKNPSPSSRRKKKSHNLPQRKLGPLSISPSKSLLLGRLPKTNKRKNLFSGSYAFSRKQRKGGKGISKDEKLCIENIEKISSALEALPSQVGNGVCTKEISALPVDQKRRTP